MQILKNIRFLRVYAISLFLVPTVALIGSILIHNYLVSFNFNKERDYNLKKNLVGDAVKFLCNKDNDYCSDALNKQQETLDKCYPYKINKSYVDEKGSLYNWQNIKQYDVRVNEIEKNNKIIFKKVEISNQINEKCILNSFEYNIYRIFPKSYEKFWAYMVKENKPPLGTSTKINPLIKGDTSISNIVKRFPINYFFKPLIYLGSIIMICYWFYNNKVLRTLKNNDKNFIFFKLGVLSATFLFLHTFFLGWTFENEILTKVRRTYVVFFIFFEVLAQVFLLKEIYSIKDRISQFTSISIIYLKMIFVVSISLFTLIILIILIKYNLDSKVDYILEWNYFLVLLIFYFLSFLLWKKPLINNPSTT